MTTHFTKLIRDKIANQISSDRTTAIGQSANQRLLPEKLVEEATEVFEASMSGDRDQVLEELADLREVSDSLARRFSISDSEIETRRIEKKNQKGGFDGNRTLSIPFTERNTRWFDGHDYTLLHFLQQNIRQSTHIDIAVSFLMQSGLNLLENALLQALGNGCRVRILTTGYLDVTEPQALRRILKLNPAAEVKMYEAKGRSFHPKTWLFRHSNGRELAVVGSSNLSHSALVSGVEWNYKVLDSDHGWPMQQAWQVFQHYFESEDSHAVDDLLVDRYDARRVPRAQIESSPPVTVSPNEAQKAALVALQKLRDSGERKAMVIAATGLGKTYLSAFDSIPFQRVLFVAHREELLVQAEKAFSKVRPMDKSQLLIRGECFDANAKLVFASVQTLASEKNQNLIPIAHFDYVVVDEFHRAAAKSYEALFDLDFAFLLGLTATPFRLDNRDLLALCDSNVAYQVNVLEAITMGWLCPFHYRGIYDATDYSKIDFRNGKYSLKSLTKALNNETRNQLVLDEYLTSGSKHALGFCTSISHSQAMSDFFNRHGVKAISLTSRSLREQRNSAIEELSTGKLRVIFTVDLFNEGVDIPCVDLVMFLRPTESVTVFLQQLGRGLRLHRDKSKLQVIDLVGNYRGADFKLPALLGMQEWSQKDITDLANLVGNGNIQARLPSGVQIEMDAQAINQIKALSKQGLQGLMVEEYQRIRQSIGQRPTMVEFMERSRFSIKMYRDRFGSWLEFLDNQDDLSMDEKEMLSEGIEFLRELEKTAMVKSYKPVIALGMLLNEGFEKGAALKELTWVFRKHFAKTRFQSDLIGTEILRIDEVSDNKLLGYVKKNPVAAWTNGSNPFFEVHEDRLVFARKLPKQIPSFKYWVDQIAWYRIEQHMASKGPENPDHKIVWGKDPNDKPHIHIDRKHSDLPSDNQFHVVVISGQKYLAKFVKIAINVIHSTGNNTSINMLEDLLRRAFPGQSREYLSTRKVRIKPIPNEVGFELEFV